MKIYCTSEQQTNTLLLPNKKIEVFSTEQLCAMMCKHPGITPSTEVFLSVARKWNLKEAQSRARLLITINSAYAATYIQMVSRNGECVAGGGRGRLCVVYTNSGYMFLLIIGQ